MGKVDYINENWESSEFTEKGGFTWGVSGAAFVGVEWYFAPKVSVGGEFGLGLSYARQSERKHDTDFDKLIVDSGRNNFEVKPFASGDLVLHFYF